MGAILKQIVQDIKTRQNWELYIAFLIALMMGTLSVMSVPVGWGLAAVLAVLAAVAVALIVDRWRLAGVDPCGVRVIEAWDQDEVIEIMSTVENHMTIVDSWFGESRDLAKALHLRQKKGRGGRVTIDLHLLNPDRQFGQQRRAEYGGQTDGSGEKWRQRYQQQLENSLDEMNSFVIRVYDDVTVNAYTYETMPELRMVSIDDRRFLFSWFPPTSASKHHVCLYLSVASLNERTRYLATGLSDYLTAIRTGKKKIGSTPWKQPEGEDST